MGCTPLCQEEIVRDGTLVGLARAAAVRTLRAGVPPLTAAAVGAAHMPPSSASLLPGLLGRDQGGGREGSRN